MFKVIADFFKFYFVTPKPQINKEQQVEPVVTNTDKVVKKPISNKPKTTRKQNGSAKPRPKK